MNVPSRRPPLLDRSFSHHLTPPHSPTKTANAAANRSLSKRARSPDAATASSVKRVKSVSSTIITTNATPGSPSLLLDREKLEKEKEERRVQRMADNQLFVAKYTEHFPKWRFYFDLDVCDEERRPLREILECYMMELGATIDEFFSKDITHLITDVSLPTNDEVKKNKENKHKDRHASGRPRERATTDGIPKESLVQKALSFGTIKIWSFAKLQSVVERLVQDSIPSVMPTNDVSTQKQRSLSKLLANERQFGSAERDPSQKRHDYHYFSKNSYFVLVEDAEQKLATIVAHEYPIERDRDGTERGSWPVLYCHPHSRGPFIEFDERERRRYEKSLRMDAEKVRQQEEQRRKAEIMREKELRRQSQLKARREGDLRRSVSMSNLHRRASMGEPGVNINLADLDGEASEFQSATPSGYLPSTGHAGYMAASGNSVGITSTTGTTSTTGGPLRGMQLPAVLRKGMQQEIVTSRRSSIMAEPRRRLSLMGPPPDRLQPTLRKSRSMNTMRLPKREEGTKPGYCESCRMRFDDFKEHVNSRKHRKFAQNDNNFYEVDAVLSRVQRKTTAQVEEERRQWDELLGRRRLVPDTPSEAESVELLIDDEVADTNKDPQVEPRNAHDDEEDI